MLAGVLVLRSLAAFAENTSAIPAEERRQCLASVLVHQDGIFASTEKGLYRAPHLDKQWVRLPTEARLPMGGTFAAEGPDTASVFSRRPPAFGPVYYFPSEWARQSFPSERAKVYGLYRLERAQWRWVLVSAEYHFQQVLVCGGTLYATVGMTEQVGGHTVYFNRVLRSKDLGKHGPDLAQGLGRRAGFGRIFRDPDHQGLVCLIDNLNRGCVLQAADDSYQWRGIRPMDWYDSHIGEMFFRPKYSTSGTLYMHVATLANYFDYPFAECPFGDCTQIPSFRITTGKAYTFKPGQRIVVPAKITFWCEGSDTVTLIDTDVGRACWGLRRTLPSGKRESVAASKDFTRGSPRVTVHRLTHGQSYDRSLDLGEIADFSAKGTYHVQLLYESFGPTGLAKGAWPGSFSGPVFDVKIE